MISSNIQTTACYILKPQARGSLLNAARRSVNSFYSDEHGIAIDQSWKIEQSKIFFAIPIIRAARQIPSYSDIEGKNVDYGL